MRLAEVVIREIERDRSLKIRQFLAESVGQSAESSAVHPQGVVLLLNVDGCNRRHRALPWMIVLSDFTTSAGLYRLAASLSRLVTE